LILVSVRLPLSAYAIPATVNGSPILYAVYWLGGKLGHVGAAASVFVGAAGVLSLVAVLGSSRPRLGTPIALGLALLAAGSASAGAVAFDVVHTRHAKKTFHTDNHSWDTQADLIHTTI